MLEINFTILLQVITFLLLLFFLNIILFRPIRKILAQRNEETGSLQGMIDEFQDRSEENEKGIEESMVQARKEGYVEKENFKGQGLEQEKGILQEANSKVEEKIGIARKEIEKKISDARKVLEGEMTGFSNELAEKILGRGVQ
jgi:F-type H+-transporting ATPase subunit b